MPALRHPVAILGGLVLLGWGALYLTRPTRASAGPVAGRLAAFDADASDGWQPLATLDGGALDAGPIVALDLSGDTLVLSHPQAISLLVGGRLVAQFGSAVVGAPEFIGRGQAIALTRDGIAQLDSRLHRVRIWGPDAQPRADVSLPVGVGATQYGPAAADGDAMLLAALHISDSSSAWTVWRVSAQGVDTLLADYARDALGNSFRLPWLTPTPEGFVLLDAVDWSILRFDGDGRRTDSTQRRDPPRFAVPARTQRKLRDLGATMHPSARRAITLGEDAPSARGLTRLPDGRLLVLSSGPDDALQAELLTADAQPVLRLWDAPQPEPLLAARGALFRIREQDERYVIERLRIRPAAP